MLFLVGRNMHVIVTDSVCAVTPAWTNPPAAPAENRAIAEADTGQQEWYDSASQLLYQLSMRPDELIEEIITKGSGINFLSQNESMDCNPFIECTSVSRKAPTALRHLHHLRLFSHMLHWLLDIKAAALYPFSGDLADHQVLHAGSVRR